jgi:Arc/MetJ-type ribon-helix-helix transcriptional regulator
MSVSSKVTKVSVALRRKTSALVQQAVARGEYASGSEVMCEALREWEHRRRLAADPMHPAVG